MTDVITLTVNPAIDVATQVARMLPAHKLRCPPGRRDPGGGGINVARVLRRLGADVTAIYPAGGVLGMLLRQMVDREGVPSLTVPIAEDTREDVTILDEATGQQYRFILPGPRLRESEWQACLDAVMSLARRARFVVASGSLPPGVPADFYGRVAGVTKQAGAKLLLDASGPALERALDKGVHLVKPSLRELSELIGRRLETERDWIAACRSLIDGGSAEMVALTMGEQGALLVARDCALRAQALPVEPLNVVGAGDSFLGGMAWGLAAGHGIETAFRYGVAAGSAALLVPGTGLCRREDVERLIDQVSVQAL